VSERASASSSFDDLYRRSDDPWDFDGDPYEQGRYQAVAAHVPPGRFGRVYEPGCSVGALTSMLAQRCTAVEACDVSPVVVARTAERFAGDPRVTVTVCQLPGGIADGPFDLVVFSELGYYFERPVVSDIAFRLVASLRPGGRLVACHWVGMSPDHRLHGDDVHDLLTAGLDGRRDMTHVAHERYADPIKDGFVLDVWDRMS
jgi:SAM-dependent methyltransferase